jgi:hypothetical protein
MFPHKIQYKFIFFSIRATCPTYLILDWVTRRMKPPTVLNVHYFTKCRNIILSDNSHHYSIQANSRDRKQRTGYR